MNNLKEELFLKINKTTKIFFANSKEEENKKSI